MDTIELIFHRANIQQIREFLLEGVKLLKINEQTYNERLNQSLEHTRDEIYKYFPEYCEQVMNEVIEITTAYQDVYMEIGLQVGMLLAFQLLNPGNKGWQT